MMKPGEIIKVIVADDHQMILEGVKTLLADAENIEVTATVSDGRELIDLLDMITADVILMDLDMPVLDGIAATKIIKEKYSRIKIIVLSVHDELGVIRKMKELGVDGYVLKNVDTETLVNAITSVHSGRKFYSNEVTESILNEISDGKPTSEKVRLTEREIEILKMVAAGLSNTEIGEKLFISHRTVDTHRTNLMKKLEVRNIAGLIRFAIKSGLVD
ncbi:MAG: response regulator transcription factor [Bacteroidota bacterium]